MKSNKLLFSLAVALTMAPGLLVAQGMSSNMVLLRINDSGTALEYNAQGSSHGRCVNSSENGCVRVTGRGSITFRLVNERRCDAGGRWELSGVQLGGENSSGKGSWGNLSQRVVDDFGADAASGWISTGSGQSISITDYNSQAYSVWYRVAAQCGGTTIYFDPRAENDGTGGLPG